MIWIYIVTWTLAFNAFDYGRLEGDFEKKFLNRSEAIKFMDGYDLPKGCCVGYKNFELDSVRINTSTEKKGPVEFDFDAIGKGVDSTLKWRSRFYGNGILLNTVPYLGGMNNHIQNIED
jgi:hypothetical protein